MTRQNYWKDVLHPGEIVDFRPVGVEGLIIPQGATVQRPLVPINGTFRYDVTTSQTELYQNGTWSPVQTTALGGEINTASNLGGGQPVFAGKVLQDLQFRSIVAGSNISIGLNANEMIINATAVGEANTASNIGTGTGTVFDSKLGNDLQFKSLISLSPNLAITNNGSNIEFTLTGLAAGEANDGVNVGAGGEVYKDKVGTDIRFRTLTGAADQITIAQGANELDIAIADDPILSGFGSITIPVGPNALEPAAANGMLRYDTDSNTLRAVIAGVWTDVATSTGTFLPLTGGAMVGDINMTAGSDIIGGPGTTLLLEDTITMIAGADINMAAGGNIVMQAAATVDGRDVSMDGTTLDNINATGVFGMVARTTNPNIFAHRNITGVTNEIAVTNGDGVAGNPTIGIAANPVLTGTGSLTLPVGTTAQQPGVPVEGMIRINSDDSNVEFYAGGMWLQSLNTVGGALTGNIDMGGNSITNVNLTDGRDLGADGAIIDEFTSIVTDTGVVVRTGGTFVSRLIQADTTISLLGASVTNGNGAGVISVGVDINSQTVTAGLAGVDTFLVYDDDIGTNVKASFNDFLTFVGTFGLDAEIDVPGELGYVTRIADGAPSPGNFERRSFVASITPSLLGASVVNGDGVLGNTEVGVSITTLGSVSGLDDNNEFIVHDPIVPSNAKVTGLVLRGYLFDGAFRASSSAVAVANGISVLPFAVGVGDFDPDTRFNNATDSFTPLAGTYRIGAYIEVDGVTVAGRYTIRIRRNGVAEGNLGVVVADGTNPDTAQFDDLFVANGTDVFTVEINNASGGASTLAVTRFFAHRIY